MDKTNSPIKVILSGPPRSGKSCFREGLKKAIQQSGSSIYPYVITACPDGEGSWFQEATENDPEVAARLKADYKAKFTPEFVDRISTSVRNVALPLTIVDIGGITSDENRQICETATHAIIIAGDPTRFAEWEEFCQELGIEIFAEIDSDYNGTEDKLPDENQEGVIRGSVHHLERGELASERPMVKMVAERLVGLATERQEHLAELKRGTEQKEMRPPHFPIR